MLVAGAAGAYYYYTGIQRTAQDGGTILGVRNDPSLRIAQQELNALENAGLPTSGDWDAATANALARFAAGLAGRATVLNDQAAQTRYLATMDAITAHLTPYDPWATNNPTVIELLRALHRYYALGPNRNALWRG